MFWWTLFIITYDGSNTSIKHYEPISSFRHRSECEEQIKLNEKKSIYSVERKYKCLKTDEAIRHKGV